MTRAGFVNPTPISRLAVRTPADVAAPACPALRAIRPAETINPRGFRKALSLMLKARPLPGRGGGRAGQPARGAAGRPDEPTAGKTSLTRHADVADFSNDSQFVHQATNFLSL